MNPDAPALITLVHSPACHFCDEAQAALADLAAEFSLSVDLVPASSAPGARLVREHRVPMYPLVLVDGVFFSFGRLPQKKLRRLLERRAVGSVA
jgi:hypothetical protein